jgi:hypothetical protein
MASSTIRSPLLHAAVADGDVERERDGAADVLAC